MVSLWAGVPCSRLASSDTLVLTAMAEEDGDVRSVDAWQQKRIEFLTRPDGWLALVGLLWPEPGANTFGTDPSNKLVFPSGAPFMGTYRVGKGRGHRRAGATRPQEVAFDPHGRGEPACGSNAPAAVLDPGAQCPCPVGLLNLEHRQQERHADQAAYGQGRDLPARHS